MLCLLGNRYDSVCVSHQVEQQDAVLTQLQQELQAERSRHQEATRQLATSRKAITDLQGDVEGLQRREREANNKVGEW